MAKSKSKSRDLTTASVKFALKTLGISSDELLNLFHEAQGSSSDDYKTWVAKEIVKNSEREDNIPLSQYKLKWAQFLSGTVDDFSTASKVSTQVREGVLDQLSGLLKDKKALWVSAGGFEDLTDDVVSMDESGGEDEGDLGFDFDWANTTSDWVGMVDLYDQLYQVLQGEFMDGNEDENDDEGTETCLVVVGELLSTRSGKKTAISTATAKELGVRDANNGEQRLYQLASSWVRSRSEDVDKVILVLHSGVDFFQKAHRTVMSEFLNSFKTVGNGVVGEFTSAHLFESAPQYKNQIVTIWESHNDGEEHDPVTLETEGVVYYQENPVSLRELTRREAKGTEEELDFGFDEDGEDEGSGTPAEGLVIFVNERTGKACLTADHNAVTVLPWVEEGYPIHYTAETKEETIERVLSSLAVNYVLTQRGYGVLVEVANGIEEHSKLIVGGVVCAVVDEALRERKKDSDNDGYSYESAKKLMGILQPLVDKYPIDLSVEGKQLLQAVEKSKDIVGKSYTQSLKVFTADLTRLAESYNLMQLR